MKDFVYQINSNECGYASVKMLLAITFKDSSYLFLPHHEDKNHQYDLLELKQIAKANGVVLSGYLINNERDLLNLKTPFIYIKTLANGSKHAVVVKKLHKRFATVLDPAIGRKTVSIKKYFQFEGNVEVLTVESYSYEGSPFELKPLLSKTDRFKIIIFEALAIICYFLAAYFLGKEYDIIIPISLMAVGAVLAITYKATSFATMKKFDEEYIGFTYDKDISKRKRNYMLLHKTKSGALNTISNIILTLSSALLINVILILQNILAIYIISSSLVLVIIDVLFISPWVRNKSLELEALENETLKDKNLSEEGYLNNCSDIKDSTYKIARLINLKRLVAYFILLVLTLILSRMTGSVDVYFVIFHFAMCMFTYTSLDNAYKSLDTFKENQINQVKFYNLINEKTEK